MFKTQVSRWPTGCYTTLSMGIIISHYRNLYSLARSKPLSQVATCVQTRMIPGRAAGIKVERKRKRRRQGSGWLPTGQRTVIDVKWCHRICCEDSTSPAAPIDVISLTGVGWMIKVSNRIIMRISTHVDKTMSFLAPMTGNGFYIPPNKMVMTGGWFMAFMTLFYPHY